MNDLILPLLWTLVLLLSLELVRTSKSEQNEDGTRTRRGYGMFSG